MLDLTVTKSSPTLTATLRGLAKRINDLHVSAAHQYEPIVENILRTGNADAQHIERTLDGLLDFYGYEPVATMYQRPWRPRYRC